MRTEIQKLISFSKFLTLKESAKIKEIIGLEKPSRILLQNIYNSWLKSIYDKTVQHFPIYLNKNVAHKHQKLCYGFIKDQSIDFEEILIECVKDEWKPINTIDLTLNLIVPQSDIMQYFIQWQRYRKYWWSSITTTPSLFSINDMNHGVDKTDVNIIANFSSGPQIVETISVNGNSLDRLTNNKSANTCSLTCSTGLETALLTLLLDGLSNSTKEEYLRLHNRMAPYKISFALDSEGMSKDESILSDLKELAQLIFYKLGTKEIHSWLPGFTLPLHLQIKENLQMGVTYTAILNRNTLSNGIFHLLNSNTMLKEQVHVADIDSYAAILCGKR